MFRYSERSRSELDTCHISLQELMKAALEVSPVDITILCGHRSKIRQMIAYQEGRSKLPWPESKHNTSPSLAVDIAPYNHTIKGVDWKDERPFYLLAGVVLSLAREMDIPVRWGGAWSGELNIWTPSEEKALNDLVHFELVE